MGSRGGSAGTGAVTMREVAARAGVSVATVSLALNPKQRDRISPDTRERVAAAVAELGYRPNAIAQSLVSGESRFIGVVADAIATTPFAGQIILGAQEEAWRHGYVLLVANTQGVAEIEADAIRMMGEHQAVGLLYSTWYHRDAVAPSGLSGIPTVFVNCVPDEGDQVAIVPDEEQGGAAATRLLTEAGHRRIAFINAADHAPSPAGRLAGYRSALTGAGLEVDPELVVTAGSEQEHGYAAADTLFALADPPTGVFCYNDRVAMGLYDRVKELGLRIPRDVSVVGFDNQEVISGHLRPSLTTIGLPHYELGAQGVRTLLDATAGGRESTETIELACPTVLRSSVAVPR